MQARELVNKVNAFHKNLNTWSLIYLSIKDTPIHQLKTLDDINIAWERYFAVMEGAAFYPDTLDQVTDALATPPLDFLNSHLYTEMKVKWNDCVQIVRADRPEPMFTIMQNFRKDLREQERKVLTAWKAERSYDEYYGTPGQLLDTIAPPPWDASASLVQPAPPVDPETFAEVVSRTLGSPAKDGHLPPAGAAPEALTEPGSGSDNTIQIVKEEDAAAAIADAQKEKPSAKKAKGKKGDSK